MITFDNTRQTKCVYVCVGGWVGMYNVSVTVTVLALKPVTVLYIL